MLQHYLKIAFRNLWKYKNQTFISIIGLAVGVTCFSLSMFWLQYEDSFDNFHPNADRIYVVQHIDSTKVQSLNQITAYPLAHYLKANFPEIEEATATQNKGILINTSSGPEWFLGLGIDTSFSKVFALSDKDISLPYYYSDDNGRIEELTHDMPTIICSRTSNKIFGIDSPVGKEIEAMTKQSFRIEKEIDSWPQNTNIKFDFLLPLDVKDMWNIQMYYTYILIKEGANVEQLKRKLAHIELGDENTKLLKLHISPLKTFRKDYPVSNWFIKYEYIRIFALVGLLIAFCGFFNYIMLFISRIRMREREFSLRRVNGSSTLDILLLLSSEFIVLLIGTTILGFALIYGLLPEFVRISKVNLPNSTIYLEALKYVLMLITAFIFISILPIYYYQKKSLLNTISKGSGKNNMFFYKLCVFVQLAVSIGFIICSLVLVKQIDYLTKRDLGFDKDRVAKVDYQWGGFGGVSTMPYSDKMKNLSSIEDVLDYRSVVGWSYSSAIYGMKSENDVNMNCEMYEVTPHFVDFFNLRFVEGNSFSRDRADENEIIINQATAKAFGWHTSVGKTLFSGGRTYNVIGVAKDFYKGNPEMRVEPIVMKNSTEEPFGFVYKYKEGMKEESEKQISQLIHNDDSEAEVIFTYMDDVYKDYYKSENALMKVLIVTTIICLIISVFGVYSMVSLICTKRRKEIAIRKVNGATTKEIFISIVSEYLILLVAAFLILSPITYKLMSVWLENYANKIEINIWIYILTLVGMAVIITSTIFMQVWRASNQNPSEVLKSE